jgi:hypothetical protein
MKPTKQLLKYLISDYLSAAAAWAVFFLYRKVYIEPLKYGYKIPIEFDTQFFLGVIIIPFSGLSCIMPRVTTAK